MRFVRFLPLLVLFAAPALAQSTVPVLVKISAGTGFFVNRDGDLVTNAHVVKNCRSISVKTISGERTASLRASDPDRDLAILRIAGDIPGIANLRWNIRDLTVGAPVVVMGYPGQEGVAGRYQFKKSVVRGLNGPTGEPQWLQLDSVAQHGNSGGPVLDTAGNVIAVITGNAMTYRVMTGEGGKRLGGPELIGQSDIAITLPVLEDFLRQHHTGYYQSSSGQGSTADRLLEARANRYIVPIRCYL